MQYKSLDVDRERLVDLLKKTMDGHIRYSYGAKTDVFSLPEEFNKIDCSGYIRWLMWQIAGYKIGDGSWNQHQKIKKDNFKPVPYENCALKDDRLRIAFMDANGDRPGHVWLTVNGMTIESYGRVGPGRRRWNNHALKSKVSGCYALTLEKMTK